MYLNKTIDSIKFQIIFYQLLTFLVFKLSAIYFVI